MPTGTIRSRPAPTDLVVDYARQPDIFRRFGAALSVGGASPQPFGNTHANKATNHADTYNSRER